MSNSFCLQSDRLHSLPELLRSAPFPLPSSGRLFRSCVIQILTSWSGLLPGIHQPPKWFFKILQTLRFTLNYKVLWVLTNVRVSNITVSNSFTILQILCLPWLVWFSGLSAGLRTTRLLVQFLVRVHAWVVGQVPGWGHVGSNWSMFLSHIDILPLFLPPFSSLSPFLATTDLFTVSVVLPSVECCIIRIILYVAFYLAICI